MGKTKHPVLEDKDRRYMVWCEDGGLPTVAHGAWDAATREAYRLSRLHPGFRFHVLRTARVYVQAAAPVEMPEEVAA